MNVKQAYKKIEDLESKLKLDLRKSFFLEQNFQAYADYSREYLQVLGKEIDYSMIEKAVRESPMMKKIWNEMDKVEYSYNDLVREVTLTRRNSIAKGMITDTGADDVHSLKSILLK